MRNYCVLSVLVLLVMMGSSDASQQGMLTTLHSFLGGDDAAFPNGPLIQGTDGAFYGTTYNYGPQGQGTVFRITPEGTITTVYGFSGGADGGHPYVGVVEGTDSNFYGSARGNIFKLTPEGTLTTLHIFTNDVYNPGFIQLVQGSDGDFYGMTEVGSFGADVVFKITSAGTVTTLGSAGGTSAIGALIEGSDGNFYGTTTLAGTNGYGTVFRITPLGELTTLYDFGFGSPTGTQPEGSLVQGIDSNFYGTTFYGGKHNDGTVFRITSEGTLTTLYSFAGGDDGDAPHGALIQAYDGNLYGVANGGVSNSGVLFQITTAGTLTTLYAFTGGTDGGGSAAPLVQGSDSNFYGMTQSGGTNGVGSIFKLSVVECSFSINPTNLTFFPAGGSSDVEVDVPNNCRWDATSNTGFVTILTGPSGAGTGVVSYTVASYGGADPRTGTMTIAGQTFTVDQTGVGCIVLPSPTSADVGPAGGAGTVGVMANGTNCGWTAASNDSFITITSGSSGLSTGTVFYTVAENDSTTPRSGTITIGQGTYTVVQSGIPCVISLGSTNAVFGLGGGTSTVGLTANGTNCGWTATSNDSFITITSDSRGAGNAVVSYSVAPGTVSRTGTMTLAGQTFRVTQGTPNGCTFKLSSTGGAFKSKGGLKTVRVKTVGTNCEWAALSSDGFITITAGTNGVGNGIVRLAVAGNTNTTSRSGVLTIAGQPFSVTQKAGGCIYSLSPKLVKFSAAGGSKTVKVKPNLADCAWTVASNAAFLTLTAGTNGVGRGTVDFSVATNTNTVARTGTITIAGQTLTVTQSGAP